jgi:hypothetical protein
MASSPPSIAPGITQVRQPVTEAQLLALGIDLKRDHPGADIADFLQYPVLAEGGWFIVIKNQRTLQSISRKPWRLLGPIELLSNGLDIA